ncbi:MAG: hypothetical protein ABIJ57_10750 [Pseudomonadota bacterium]|nr:hypothetical protein [Pseudomonadota bacterium]MBU1184601.1 hypothetical protein [Pseudomonadota bacterium]MBU3931368.1 hypothetical protein [Pseudomonadota bacterium]
MSLDFEFTLEQKMIEESVWRWASSWLEPQMEELYEKEVTRKAVTPLTFAGRSGMFLSSV